MRWLVALALLAAAPASLEQRVTTGLASASPGTRFGLLVVDPDGREVVALLPDQRFVPASNTKIFTTAALFASGIDLDGADTEGGASVALEGHDVVLRGHGDPRLSGAADCMVDCLATLADAVAARTRSVRDVIGDDSWFPDERWSPGMSWNNLATPSGTGVSALTIDNNELALNVAADGAVSGNGYYAVDNRVTRGAATALGYDRAPGSRTVRVTGTVAAAKVLKLGVDDPAAYAAWQLAAILRARGVRVTGAVAARHRPLDAGDDPARRGAGSVARAPEPPALARLVGPPLRDTATITNKVSQNIYAELILRRLGRVAGTGSIADGQAAVARILDAAGVPRVAYDFADGSGMSSYNRVSPRATVTFLRWVARQPWGAAWRATLPTNGEGTLRRRFAAGPPIAAKTGTLNGTSALAGWLRAKSGRELVFAAYAGDVPGDAALNAAIDRALVTIAAEN